MVLTKSELIASLPNEVRIQLHLVGKVDGAMLDYRPTAKQRNASDADFRSEIPSMGGGTTSRGAMLVELLLCGSAAYRTQLFLYLKAGGREELSTTNLWAGVDTPAAPAAAAG
jgi:hypothetical protein